MRDERLVQGRYTVGSIRDANRGPRAPLAALIPLLHRALSAESLSFSSGSLPTRQVQMFDVAIPLVVELVLSASYILPPSSSPASFVLVFLLIFFLAFSLRLP